MGLEETLAALLDAKLAPLREQVRGVTAELEALRRTLPPALVTIPGAAERLGVSIATVRRQIRDGSLPSRRIGRSLRVDLAGLHGPTEEEMLGAALDRR